MQNDRARSNPRARAHFDIAENFRAGTDHDAVADFRVPVAGFVAGAAESHILQDRNVVVDYATSVLGFRSDARHRASAAGVRLPADAWMLDDPARLIAELPEKQQRRVRH
jgi:hypothetical protein